VFIVWVSDYLSKIEHPNDRADAKKHIPPMYKNDIGIVMLIPTQSIRRAESTIPRMDININSFL
jgi:hypothetical protein